MKKSIKDKKLRKLFTKIEYKRLLLKSIAFNEFLSMVERKKAMQILSKIHGTTRIRNRCIETSRSRGVLSVFRLARSKFHIEAGTGILPGVRKSSW